MTIKTVAVRDIACLFFQRVAELAGNSMYGIECEESTLLAEIEKLLRHYEFNCYYNDYIREMIEMNSDDIDNTCDRESFSVN